jgi:hypothetical protein
LLEQRLVRLAAADEQVSSSFPEFGEEVADNANTDQKGLELRVLAFFNHDLFGSKENSPRANTIYIEGNVGGREGRERNEGHCKS